MFENVDAIRVAHRAEAVGDDEAGAVDHEAFQCLLDEALRLGVHAGGGFVQEENGGILQEGAGDGDALFFTDTEADPAFADLSVEFVRESFDKFPGVGSGQGLPEFVVRGLAFGDDEIVADGAIEEETFLSDVTHGPAKAGFGDIVDRLAVDGDAAAISFVESGQQIDGGGFARTRGADEGDGLAGFRFEADALKCGGLAAVGENHIFENHMARRDL